MNYLLKKVLLCCFLLLGFLLLQAQGRGRAFQNVIIGNCDFSAPNNLEVVESGTTHFVLSWDAVTGASTYRVIITDVVSGIVEINDFAYTTTYQASPLTPGREYSIRVAAVCSNGIDGDYSEAILRATGVIIVDIVIQFSGQDCDPHTWLADVPMTNPTNWTKYYYPINVDESLSISGIKLNSDFNVVIKHMGGAPNALIGFHDRGVGMALSQNPGKKTLLYNSTPIFTVDIVSSPNFMGEFVALEIDNNQTVNVEKCQNVRFGNEHIVNRGMIDPDVRQLSSSLGIATLAPNPTSDVVRVQLAQDTQLEIFDIRGQRWYSNDVRKGAPLTVDAREWPAGTYFLRCIENGEAIVHRFVKL